METNRKCTECESGVHVSPGFEFQGSVYPTERRTCSTCLGSGVMAAPDFAAIFAAVTTARGAAKGSRRFRQSPPELWKQSNQGVDNRRAYYVWRMARFHGGADVTMPMMADLFCGRDCWRPELDAYAEALAIKVFGTDMAAAHRWSSVLRGTTPPAGLPDTAYPCGPVHDGHKPGFEREELK
jgi:hypothetical protein